MNNHNLDQAVVKRFFTLVEQQLSERAHGKVLSFHDPATLKEKLTLDLPGGQADWEQLFTWVEKFLKYSVKTHHPSFVNRMWSGGNLPSIIGEIIAAVSNTSACTYESAPVSTLVEQYMLQTMLELVGFVNGEAQMTTGSSNANMIAMLIARNRCHRAIKKTGLFAHNRLVGFVSEEAHYSLHKAANLLGIGEDNLLSIPVDQKGCMRIAELEKQIDAVKKVGSIPFFVAATAGTTVRGAYDDIPALVSLRCKEPFWLHVDGAWGGSAVLSPKLRAQYLPGLEQVDSFTLDFHKMIGVTLMCNVLMLNKKQGTLMSTCRSGDDSYLFRDHLEQGAASYDLGESSLQCGRRVDSLKWFLDWKFYGQAGLAKRIETYLKLCCAAEEIVESAEALEMVVPRQSFNVCFRYRAPPHWDCHDLNRAIGCKLYQTGEALIGTAYIKGELCFRLLIANPEINFNCLKLLFDQLISLGDQLIASEKA